LQKKWLIARALLAQCVKIAKLYKDVYLAMNDADKHLDRRPYINELANELEQVRSKYDKLAGQISSRISRMYVADFDNDR
jgi:hypothetical protein